ncbi:MAG: magnesium transporter [Chloroflexota bacterium]
MTLRTTINPRARELIARRDWLALRAFLADVPPQDVAELLAEVDEPERVIFFTSLSGSVASAVFSHLEPNDKDALLRQLKDENTRRLLADLSPDDRAELFADLPGQVTQRLLNLLSPEDLAEVRLLLGFPEDSVGRLMTPHYVAVRSHWTIERALAHIRRRGRQIETIGTVYVIDDSWRLLDSLSLERFVLAELEGTVESIMDRSFIALNALDDREEAVRRMEHYDLQAVPVVDQHGVMLGIVTVDDVFDVAEEEATEDFQRVAAVAPLDSDYSDASIWRLYRKRIGWLLILILVNLISSAVIAASEEMLTASIVLASFIPLLIGSGGNTGAQSATLLVRALATADVIPRQWPSTVLKEVAVGAVLGITMGLAASVLGLLRGGSEIAMVVGLTMTLLVIVANLIGVALPFALTRLGIDPAVASNPLIATIVDATGLLIYFAVAGLILSL